MELMNLSVPHFHPHHCVPVIPVLCFRHERIHTKKGSNMKSHDQAADDVDDLATLEVLDEVRLINLSHNSDVDECTNAQPPLCCTSGVKEDFSTRFASAFSVRTSGEENSPQQLYF